jgi:hypothetical protein
LPNTDWSDSTTFKTNDLFSVIYFFFYKRLELTYELEESENEIIQKGYEILKKYLKGRKYGNECDNYGKNINKDLSTFILSKNISNHILRCYFLNEIFECPIKNKYFFKYLNKKMENLEENNQNFHQEGEEELEKNPNSQSHQEPQEDQEEEMNNAQDEDSELMYIYEWVDSIELSRPKKILLVIFLMVFYLLKLLKVIYLIW